MIGVLYITRYMLIEEAALTLALRVQPNIIVEHEGNSRFAYDRDLIHPMRAHLIGMYRRDLTNVMLGRQFNCFVFSSAVSLLFLRSSSKPNSVKL